MSRAIFAAEIVLESASSGVQVALEQAEQEALAISSMIGRVLWGFSEGLSICVTIEPGK